MNLSSIALAIFITPLFGLHLMTPWQLTHFLAAQQPSGDNAASVIPLPAVPQQLPMVQQQPVSPDEQHINKNKSQPSNSSYAIIQAAQQPKSSPTKNLQGDAPPLAQTAQKETQRLSIQLTRLRNRLQAQPKQFNNSVIKPCQRKVAQLKQTLSTAIAATLRGDVEIKTQLKSALIGLLEHIATKASQAAELLKQPQTPPQSNP